MTIREGVLTLLKSLHSDSRKGQVHTSSCNSSATASNPIGIKAWINVIRVSSVPSSSSLGVCGVEVSLQIVLTLEALCDTFFTCLRATHRQVTGSLG